MKLYTPFSTRLSGSARETELRLKNIFQWKKKRPPMVLIVLVLAIVLSCGGLVACRERRTEHTPAAITEEEWALQLIERTYDLPFDAENNRYYLRFYDSGDDDKTLILAEMDDGEAGERDDLFLGLWDQKKGMFTGDSYQILGNEGSFAPVEIENGTALFWSNTTFGQGGESCNGLGYFVCQNGKLTKMTQLPQAMKEHELLDSLPDGGTILKEYSPVWDRHKVYVTQSGIELYEQRPDWGPSTLVSQWRHLGTVLFSSDASTAKESKDIAGMQLLYAEDKLEYYPDFPKAEYPGGLKVYYQGQSEDVPRSQDVKYSSDDPKVFTVLENGSIIPTGVGTANLTAEYGGQTVTQAFTIKAGTIVSIETEQPELVLKAGTPPPASIPVYAVGSNGYRFEIEGPAQISVKQGDKVLTNGLNGIDLAPNQVTVLEVAAYDHTACVEIISVDPETSAISASVNELSLSPNEETAVNLYAEVAGRKADISHLISWSSTDENVAAAVDGFVSANKSGRAELTASFGSQSITIPVEVK